MSFSFIWQMSDDIYASVKKNEWAPRPISAKTAPVSTNRAVNFGYRAIFLPCLMGGGEIWVKALFHHPGVIRNCGKSIYGDFLKS